MSWPTTWKGIEVLTIEPSREGPFEDEIERRFVALDQLTGVRWHDERAPAPAPVRPFLWTAFGRAEIAFMRAFLDARKGLALPFWLPSWQQDLSLSADVIEDQEIVSLVWVGYTNLQFPHTLGRRHLAAFSPVHDASYHEVQDANDPGDHVTESITIDPGAARDWPASTTVLSFLRLCRLEDDKTETAFHSNHVAQATIRVREIPNEVPA